MHVHTYFKFVFEQYWQKYASAAFIKGYYAINQIFCCSLNEHSIYKSEGLFERLDNLDKKKPGKHDFLLSSSSSSSSSFYINQVLRKGCSSLSQLIEYIYSDNTYIVFFCAFFFLKTGWTCTPHNQKLNKV